VYVCLNVRVVDPVVTQLLTQQLILYAAEVAQEALSAPAYGCGPTRIRQPARSLLFIIVTLVLPCNRASVLVLTLAVGQVTKGGATRRGQV
jgi:hypothetical protein